MILQFHSLKSLVESKRKLWKYPILLWWILAALEWRWGDRSRVWCQVLVLPCLVSCLERGHGVVQPETLNLAVRAREAAVILVGIRAFLTISVGAQGNYVTASRGFEEGILLTGKQSENLSARSSKKTNSLFWLQNNTDLCNQSPDSFGICSNVVLYFLRQSKSFMILPVSAFHLQ